MRRKLSYDLVVLIAVVLIFQLTGCSIVGLGIGASSSGIKDPHIQEKKKFNIKPGTTILIVRKSGVKITGKYTGLVYVSPKEYDLNYSKVKEQYKEAITLPKLGVTIAAVTEKGASHTGQFLGFDKRFGQSYIIINQAGESNPNIWNLAFLRNIELTPDKFITAEEIRNMISAGKIPLISSGIEMKSKFGNVRITWEEVDKVLVKKNYASQGFLMGLLIDVGVIITAAITGPWIAISIGM